ncbi:MAG TPA: M28 family peptidase [Gemmatimonadales bacterium]|nr:M28 family peptidase [Gemmatimonadales bacterium]
MFEILAWKIGIGARLPGTRPRSDANLIAVRGDTPVSTWLVAHVDTKAQAQSMAGRLISIWVVVIAVVVLILLAGWRLVSGAALPPQAAACGAAVALIAALFAAGSRLRGSSPGARDNGTGLLAVLSAAQDRPGPTVGIILTGAEEFGLLGARHLARAEPGLLMGTEVINLDTLADRGAFYIVTHNSAAVPLANRLQRRLEELGLPITQRRLPVGILVDSLAMARLASGAVTVARLDWTVLRLMHTPRDANQGLDPGFAEAVGRLIGTSYQGGQAV